MNNDHVVTQVYSTKDYDKFKHLHGNRECVTRRKNKILQSIKSVGWVRNPIIVNKNMEIIDGEGRLQALRELGAEVEYVIDENAGKEECIALNLGQENWKPIDFCRSYASANNRNYIRILECLEAHNSVTLQTLFGIVYNRVVNSGTGSVILKNGELVFTESWRETIEPSLVFLDENAKAIKMLKGQQRMIQTSLAWIYNNTNCDMKRLLRLIETKYMLFPPAVETIQFLSGISDVYNKGLSAKNCVYLDTEYKKAMREA